MDRSAEIFEKHRPELFNLAYGMLGRKSLAEDMVQEAWLRWSGKDPDPGEIDHTGAYLSTIVTRLCLDELKSAKQRRETYIGPNLPEPVLASSDHNPEEQTQLADALSMALMFLLEKLNPVHRAVFILREVFNYPYPEIAEIVDKSEAHCRKIAQRARERIRIDRSSGGFKTDRVAHRKLLESFVEAVQEQDISRLESLLAEEAVLYSDGGGKVTAARKPIYGAGNIARFMAGISGKALENVEVSLSAINGEPGLLVYFGNELQSAWAFQAEESSIKKIFAVLNPEKLQPLRK